MKPKSLPIRTWILIADGSRARILEALGEGSGLRQVSGDEVIEDSKPASPENHVLSGSQSGDASSRQQSVARALEALFASQLAAMLAGYLRSNTFDRLVIVAPAPMLAELRKMIRPDVREKIVAEIVKDLTKIPNTEISVHLDDVVTF